MIRFAEVFPDQAIVNALRTQLSWTHFRELTAIEDPLKREFYAELCRAERWTTRTLRHKIGHLLFERTAVSKKPDELIADDLAALRDKDRMTPDLVFRDPYFLDFLGLTGTYAEPDLEQAILRELEAFILEMGATSPSSPGRSACQWTMRTTTSICYSITAVCADWWRSN